MRWRLAVLAIFLTAPIPHAAAAARTGHAAAVRERGAIDRSLAVLQDSARQWLVRSECASCHHQALEIMTAAAAQASGFTVDTSLVARQTARMERDLAAHRQAMLEAAEGQKPVQIGPNPEMIFGYLLVGIAESHARPDPLVETTARYLLSVQSPDGGWRSREKRRPPLEPSDFAATALIVHAISLYGPQGTGQSERATSNAVRWLCTHVPVDTEDRTFRLLGLHWAHADAESIAQAAGEVLEHQRSDGGWSQLDVGDSDAYATGESLVALRRSGALGADDQRFRNGVAFLLRTQEGDGSWHVRSRARPIQRYFETGFPHGRDQFISYAATCWATMALLTDDVRETATSGRLQHRP